MRTPILLALLCLTTSAAAAEPPPLRIDVPVVLKEAKVVFNLDHHAFLGDQPIGLEFMRLMTERLRADGTKARIVAIFHGDGGYLALNDATYATVRHWPSGNPYKGQIAALMQAGAEIEICGETMIMNRWGNDVLLPRIKVNTGANFRIVELVQQGFVAIQP